MSAAYEQAAALLRASKHAVALTGAGISTPSGIPDFRTPGTGLWSQVNPEEVASIQAFVHNPAVFYDWFVDSAQRMAAAQPNPAHLALAELERRGNLRAIVTQNIDGLHQQAGSQRVLELHGNSRTASCMRCRQQADGAALVEQYARDRQVPRCSCGGVFKPDVVLFGEMLPFAVLAEAREEVAHCDLLLVVGSSLVVAPAADLPWLAIQQGTTLIICNRDSTWADGYAAVVLRDNVAESLPAIVMPPST